MTCKMCEIETQIGTKEVPHPVDIRLHTCPPDGTTDPHRWKESVSCRARKGIYRCAYDCTHGQWPKDIRHHEHIDSRGRSITWTTEECDPPFTPDWEIQYADGYHWVTGGNRDCKHTKTKDYYDNSTTYFRTCVKCDASLAKPKTLTSAAAR